MDYRSMTHVSNILLTGATGVMGGRLLLEVLATTDAQVYCLSRGEDHADAKRRIEQMLWCYDPQRTMESQTWRIVPLLGDVSQPHLGMDAETWQELAGSIDLVLHCAANVNLVASYSKIAPVNVGGAANMAEFCLAGGIPMLFTSSFSVIGDKLYHDVTLNEDDLDLGQRFSDMDYERSKFEAEKLIQAAGRRGLDFVIVRPGNIWGDSVTGCYPLRQTKVKGLYYEMIRSLCETGLTFSSTEDFDITPVDYVARASLHAAMNIGDCNRRTFNLVNPNPIHYDTIASQVRNYGFTVREMRRQDYFDALKEGRVVRSGKQYRSTFTDLLSVFVDSQDVMEQAKYDTRGIRGFLAGSDIACHACDMTLMTTYLNYAVAEGFIAAPGSGAPLAEISIAPVRGGFMEQLYDSDLNESALA